MKVCQIGWAQTGGHRRWLFRRHAGLRRPGLRGLLWLVEARGLANRISDEGLGWPGPGDKSEECRWAGLAQAPSIKVRGSGAGLACRYRHQVLDSMLAKAEGGGAFEMPARVDFSNFGCLPARGIARQAGGRKNIE